MDLRASADIVENTNDPQRSSHFQAKPNKKTEFELYKNRSEILITILILHFQTESAPNNEIW